MAALTPTVRQLLLRGAAAAADGVTVKGWVSSVRMQKRFAFINVNDGTTPKGIQIVCGADDAKGLTTGASVSCHGKLVQSPGKEQAVELQASAVQLLGPCPTETYPLQKKEHSFEFLREIAHLRPRSRVMSSVLRVRNEAAWAVHRYFRENEFMQAHTPIITSTDCEGAGEAFRVRSSANDKDPAYEFFGTPAYLTVSGQLQAEIMASAMPRVYTFGPTFRAENSQTARHLAEFWMVEAEVAFMDSLAVLNVVTGGLLSHVVGHVLASCPEDIDRLHKAGTETAAGPDASLRERLERIATAGIFPSIAYSDAVKTLQDTTHDFKQPVVWEAGLQTEHERFLAEHVFHGPVFVTDYPREIKPFYMRVNEDNRTVAAVDLLVPRIGELSGGSLREERQAQLEAQMQRCRLDQRAYDWYVDLRRFGTTRHGGFGMGFERLVMLLTGIQNVRDAIPFPRHVGSCPY